MKDRSLKRTDHVRNAQNISNQMKIRKYASNLNVNLMKKYLLWELVIHVLDMRKQMNMMAQDLVSDLNAKLVKKLPTMELVSHAHIMKLRMHMIIPDAEDLSVVKDKRSTG